MPLIPQVGRNKFSIRFIFILISILLWVGILLHLFPIWWILRTSLGPAIDTFKVPPSLFPSRLTIGAYTFFLHIPSQFERVGFQPLAIYLKNSAIITGGVMLTQVFFTATIAYALS